MKEEVKLSILGLIWAAICGSIVMLTILTFIVLVISFFVGILPTWPLAALFIVEIIVIKIGNSANDIFEEVGAEARNEVRKEAYEANEARIADRAEVRKKAREASTARAKARNESWKEAKIKARETKVEAKKKEVEDRKQARAAVKRKKEET